MIDNRGLAPLTDESRRDLLEILDDRHSAQSTIITRQLPVKHWHKAIGDPTLADGILDRPSASYRRSTACRPTVGNPTGSVKN
jgi:hypothetical protein